MCFAVLPKGGEDIDVCQLKRLKNTANQGATKLLETLQYLALSQLSGAHYSLPII